MNKTLKVMTSAALLAGVVAPVAVTTVDAANSKVIVYSVPTVADDFESEISSPNTAFTSADAISVIQIKADDLDIPANSRFRLELPTGVKFVKDAYDPAASNTKEYVDDATYAYNVNVISVTDQVLELETSAELNSATVADIPLFVKVDGATGDLKVTVNSLDSSLSSGAYTFAVAEGGSASVTIDSVKTIGESGAIAAIRIDENSVEALGEDAQEIKLRLPNKFTWDDSSIDLDFVGFGTITSGDGTTEGTYDTTTANDGRDLVVKFNPGNRTTRGTIYVKGLEVETKSDAPFGEVVVDVSGDEIDSTDLTVAKYADYGVTFSVDGEPKEIVAGVYSNNDSTADELKAAKINIKEAIAGSIIENRDIKIKLPSWVKIRAIETEDFSTSEDADVSNFSINSDRNEITFEKTGSTKLDFGLQLYLTVEADQTGDIVAEVSSRNAGVEDAELVIAKAVAPVTVNAKAADVVVGVTEQALTEITIVEPSKEAIKEGKLTIVLPDNVKFSGKPTVEVTEGNIDLGDIDVEDFDGDDDRQLVIEVDSESTKASTIKITNAKLSLDRTVPVGPIVAKLGGDFIENYTTDDSVDTQKFEDTDAAVEFAIANVVTPAPGQSVAKEVQFTLGSTTYTVAGEEKTMDVAPFVEAGRTFMPIRYVAEAVGVTSDSIFWDQATSTATLIKGDRVVQLTNGSKSLKVNGASITMDAAAQVKDGRTVLPVRFVGQALGATVDYNEADKTVTIK